MLTFTIVETMTVSEMCCFHCLSGAFMFAGVTVGFASEVVTVAEDGGNVVLTDVLTGLLQRNVLVRLKTNSNTALGKRHKGLSCLQLPVFTLQQRWT